MPRDDGGGRRIVFEDYGRPKDVEGGLTARSRRGAIGRSWWSGRFVQVLTELGVGGRLDRGRTYARRGQVVDLDVAPGHVTATVQGSRDEPYRVRIGLRPFADEAWEAVEEAFAADSWYAASLLSGEVPDDLETVFARAGLSLFPTGSADLPMDCSCPDWSVPCKHLAAAMYLLAERFDDDPFEILLWRGRDRATLLSAIRARREDAAPAVTPLSDAAARFFDAGGPLPEVAGTRAAAARRPDGLLDAMPPLGVRMVDPEGGDVDLRDGLRAVYQGFGVGMGTWPAS